MQLSHDLLDEIDLLSLFPLTTTHEGIKVHHSAGQTKVDAASRLFGKGITSQPDGGYLTDRGVEVAEHLALTLNLLKADNATCG